MCMCLACTACGLRSCLKCVRTCPASGGSTLQLPDTRCWQQAGCASFASVSLQCAPKHRVTCLQDVPGTSHQDVKANCTGCGPSPDLTKNMHINLKVTSACLIHLGILWSVQYQCYRSLYKP